ncbi:hypothetical protein HELRODRAFT_70830 [Helobdella robusta]|uniref:DH domain-containing protein n=1 Tax=Helobdella robusta TaxID=6412 RepID=T1G0C8_HELRO|nr:hypothetical protein HELRODRAFT_70830 [Helobdella robusta]ESN90724.1 hypothetical protein HELRODRAFT_70830 [Helobdella robusta]
MVLTKEDNNAPVFVINNFEGSIYYQLMKHRCRIVAPPVILRCAFNRPLPIKTRPVYCLSMENAILCFSGFKTKENLTLLVDLVHRMGGSIRREFSSRVTHLVANSTSGDKYRAAVGMGTRVMSEEWIHKCWELKEESFFDAISFEVRSQYKLSPFAFSVLSFYGFPNDEIRHMEEVAYGAPMTTHLIVNDRSVRSIPFDLHCKLHVVKSEWFWASIQMEACADESLYIYDEETACLYLSVYCVSTIDNSNNNNNDNSNGCATISISHSSSGSNYFNQDNATLFATATAATTSTANNNSNNNISSCHSSKNSSSNIISNSREMMKLTLRQQTVLELYQTERNYVGILDTIIKVFMEELVRVDQPGGPILDAQEVKSIFGGIVNIHDIHVQIRDELNDVVSNWLEDLPVGNIFIKHSEELMKFYPNFINYFEKSKEFIHFCDKFKPRFHAFLKLCQSKPECGRQTLTELLIRPVQRLPSVTLLLKDILKRTEESHLDYKLLQDSIVHLEAVMMHINEDKRKSDGHQVMFEIVNDIENCPVSLLSAHRSFSTKVDVTEVTDSLIGRGSHLTLFIFSDSVEVGLLVG